MQSIYGILCDDREYNNNNTLVQTTVMLPKQQVDREILGRGFIKDPVFEFECAVRALPYIGITRQLSHLSTQNITYEIQQKK